MLQKISKAAFGDIYIVEHREKKQKRCLKLYEKELMKNTN